jgi:peptidoglycan L-alanyl-D-glutamate endopeptidase CwlK
MVYVFEGFRPMERQAYLYQQGRSSPGKIVTNAGEGLSLHNYGLAVDLVFDGDKVKPGFQWTWSGNYEAVGALIKKNKKLVWAGTWRSFKEYPHVEIKLPFTAVQLKAIYDQKKDLKELWKFLDQEL